MDNDRKSNRTGLMIDALGDGNIQLAFCFPGAKVAVLTGIPKRQARAIANRILHEIDYAEGRRPRRPSEPHIGYEDLVQFAPEYLDRIGLGKASEARRLPDLQSKVETD